MQFIGIADIYQFNEMSEETRICKVCGEEKPITSFYKNGGMNRVWRCSKCYNKQCVARRTATPEKKEASQISLRKWKKENIEKVRVWGRQSKKRWRTKHRETYRQQRKAWKKKNKRLLGNSYVAERLGLPTALVPAPLLDAMRAVIKSRRILYKLRKRTITQNAPEAK